MKNASLIFTLIIAVSFTGMSFTLDPGKDLTGTFSVDAKTSTVNWKGYKVTGEHFGTVNIKSGALQFAEGKLTGGTFEIDMNSISTKDMQGGGATRLDGHLKSDDFFGVEKYPVSKLVITKVISRGKPGEYKVIGNLTIKETTKEIKFDAVVTENNGIINATAAIKIDRSEYNVRFGSGSFFDNLGDKTIYDEFDLTVNLTTTPK